MTRPVELNKRPVGRSGFPPQCQMIVEPQSPCDDEWRQKRYERRKSTAGRLGFNWDPKLCQKSAAYSINDCAYCRGHAGQLAIEKWTNGELVERER
jgi:hypothetical protein